MGMNKLLYVLGVLVALPFCIADPGWAQPKPDTRAPIITNSFAVEKGYYGHPWKIYIEAEAPSGDMFKIASVVKQVGYGSYPTDWIILKPKDRHHLKGYLQWNTLSGYGSLPEGTDITLKVSILDKAGRESNVVVFPFTFETGVKDQHNYKLPAPFNEGSLPRLGYIAIELTDPAKVDGG